MSPLLLIVGLILLSVSAKFPPFLLAALAVAMAGLCSAVLENSREAQP